MGTSPSRIAVVAGGPDLPLLAREIAALRAGPLVLVGGSPGEGEAVARDLGAGCSGGRDLEALSGCRLVILAIRPATREAFGETVRCVVRYAPGAVVLIAAQGSIPLAGAFLASSRMNPRQVIALGGLPGQLSRAAAWGATLGVDSAQVHLLVAGTEEPRLIELHRHTVIAGIPAAIIASPEHQASVRRSVAAGDGPGSSGRAAAAAVLADAVLRDRRRILCCGSHLDGAHGLPSGFVTMPAIVGARGVEGIFPVMLDLEERSFVERSVEAAGG